MTPMPLRGHDQNSREVCLRPDIGQAVCDYCFGDASQAEMERFEAHLLDCPRCWEAVQSLDAAVRIMRTDKHLTRSRFLPDILRMAGISAGLDRVLSGQLAHVWFVAILYGLMISVSVFMEVAYRYGELGSIAWTAAPAVFLWSAGSLLVAFECDRSLTASGRRSGLAVSVAVLSLAAALMYGAIRPWLPPVSVTQATFQTWTAQAAFLKGVVYCWGFAICFSLLPFHAMVTIFRKLRMGGQRIMFELMTGGRLGIVPSGLLIIPVWLLPILLITGAGASILSTAHLLEALRPSEYTNLFIHTILIRWVLFLALGAECAIWYYMALNAVRAECVLRYRMGESSGTRAPGL